MSKIYEQNIGILLKQMPFLKEKINVLNKIEIENTTMLRGEQEKLEFFENGNYYKVCSAYPQEEAEFLTRGMEEKKDNLVIVYTIANLALLHKIMEKMTADGRILVYEPNLYLLKYALTNYDLSFLLESEKVVLLFGFEATEEVKFVIRNGCGIEWKNLVKNICVISPPNTILYKEKNHYITKIFLEILNVQINLLGNSLEDIFFGLENNYKNVDAIIENSDLREIKNKFRGYPAIIVASGPSLDKNIDILQKAQDKAVIITCDASYQACRKHNVKPDAIASIERGEATYKFYYEGKTFDENMVLVGPSLLWPKLIEEYPGRKIITNRVNYGIDKWWEDNFDNFYYLEQGASCANVAFIYAFYAGCNPIILMGQDLAYTENKIHSDLTHTKYEGANQGKSKEGLLVEDIYGNMIPTAGVYNWFRNWFEAMIIAFPDLKVIDATEGGAKIHGSEIMTLQEAISAYCRQEIPMHLVDCLSEEVILEPSVYIEKYKHLIEETKKQKECLKNLQRCVLKYYEMLKEIYKKELEKMSKGQLAEEIIKLQEGDKIINEIMKNPSASTYFQQLIQQTIIRMKALGMELTVESVRRNIILQANLMATIKASISKINQEYDKMIAFLEEKKAKREAELKKC